jgi:hypothetical protein
VVVEGGGEALIERFGSDIECIENASRGDIEGFLFPFFFFFPLVMSSGEVVQVMHWWSGSGFGGESRIQNDRSRDGLVVAKEWISEGHQEGAICAWDGWTSIQETQRGRVGLDDGTVLCWTGHRQSRGHG